MSKMKTTPGRPGSSGEPRENLPPAIQRAGMPPPEEAPASNGPARMPARPAGAPPAAAGPEKAGPDAQKAVRARAQSLELTIGHIKKKCGTGSIMYLGADHRVDVKVIPTGSLS